ncbi:hypothetical protein HMN09_00453800 [Mycena chlorophos]|uniref:Uncharacterized protein n=1 Tax=Mycena chlorophos TaxID=658473 RepID=A0A8H6WFW3_MYCCL|nr:hypothetical protein HMN09_00453800 [Mycena chlorophos]
MFPFLLAAFASLHGALALLTPTGRTPSGKDIYTVPPGSRIAAYSASQIEVLAPNGTLLHTFSDANSPSPSPSKREDYNDHFAQAYYDCGVDPSTGNTTQILTLNATFVVPPIPENYESQFFFFGPSLEGFDPVTNVSVGLYQAALQYGASLEQGGPFWTLYATFESSTFYIKWWPVGRPRTLLWAFAFRSRCGYRQSPVLPIVACLVAYTFEWGCLRTSLLSLFIANVPPWLRFASTTSFDAPRRSPLRFQCCESLLQHV